MRCHGPRSILSPRQRIRIALSTLLAISIAGCASQQAAVDPNMSALERANANYSSTVATGAVTGAVVGAAAGALLSRRNPAAGAMVGGVLGGALGTSAGVMVANNNSQQAQTEDTLQAQIATAQRDAEDARKAAEEARGKAAEIAAEMQRLQEQRQAGQITSEQYQQQIAGAVRFRQQVHALIDHLASHETQLRQQIAANGQAGGAMTPSLDTERQARRSLEQTFDNFNQTASALPQT